MDRVKSSVFPIEDVAVKYEYNPKLHPNIHLLEGNG